MLLTRCYLKRELSCDVTTRQQLGLNSRAAAANKTSTLIWWYQHWHLGLETLTTTMAATTIASGSIITRSSNNNNSRTFFLLLSYSTISTRTHHQTQRRQCQSRQRLPQQVKVTILDNDDLQYCLLSCTSPTARARGEWKGSYFFFLSLLLLNILFALQIYVINQGLRLKKWVCGSWVK